MTHWGRLLQLTVVERGVLLQAITLVAVVRFSLWVFPFRTLHRSWSLILPGLARAGQRHIIPPKRIVWLVAVASRCVPGAHCLPRAVAAQLLLARAGHLAEMHIGVRKLGDSLDAHVWLEYDGVPLSENEVHLRRFTPFAPVIPPTRNTVRTSR